MAGAGSLGLRGAEPSPGRSGASPQVSGKSVSGRMSVSGVGGGVGSRSVTALRWVQRAGVLG